MVNKAGALFLAAALSACLVACESPQTDRAVENDNPAKTAATAAAAPTHDGVSDAPLTPEERAMFTVQLQCGDTPVEFALQQNGSAEMRIAGTSYAMRNVKDATGVRYENPVNPGTTFWNNGSAARVSLDNEELPACAVLPSAAKEPASPYVAYGNEPGWRLTIASNMLTLEADYGELTMRMPVTADSRSDEVRSVTGAAGRDRIHVSIAHKRCADDMSGDLYDDTVIVEINGRRLTGCGGDHWLRNVNWQLHQIQNSDLVGDTRLTLEFGANSELRGSAGCNRFQGRYSQEGGALSIDQAIAASKRRCALDAVMRQEARYLELLPMVTSAALDASGALVLAGDSGALLRFRKADED